MYVFSWLLLSIELVEWHLPSLQPRHSTCIFVSVSDTEKRVRVLECGADCDSSEGSAICPDYFHFPLKPAQLISVGGEWGESASE